MLRITVPAREFYNEELGEFFEVKEQTLTMEHSLISLSKWEAKWKKPYLTKDKKTNEEILDYFRCMTITPNVDPLVYRSLTEDNLKEIAAYIEDPMTATTFRKGNEQTGPVGKKEIITSEILYYYMIAQNIPPEYEKWHLNRLMTLIKVCAIKNNPKQKKMTKSQIYSQNRALNAARRRQYNTRG